MRRVHTAEAKCHLLGLAWLMAVRFGNICPVGVADRPGIVLALDEPAVAIHGSDRACCLRTALSPWCRDRDTHKYNYSRNDRPAIGADIHFTPERRHDSIPIYCTLAPLLHACLVPFLSSLPAQSYWQVRVANLTETGRLGVSVRSAHACPPAHPISCKWFDSAWPGVRC